LAFPTHQTRSRALGISSASCIKYPAKQDTAYAPSSKSYSTEEGHSLDLPQWIIECELLSQAMPMVEQIIQLRQKTQKICLQPRSYATHRRKGPGSLLQSLRKWYQHDKITSDKQTANRSTPNKHFGDDPIGDTQMGCDFMPNKRISSKWIFSGCLSRNHISSKWMASGRISKGHPSRESTKGMSRTWRGGPSRSGITESETRISGD
jgi:hypothetical protein